MIFEQEPGRSTRYGVCGNPKCALSSLRPELDKLYVLLDEIDVAIQHDECFESMVPPLYSFVGYFQNMLVCVQCSGPIQCDKVTLVDVADPGERARIELTNEALHGLRELQALGVIPGEEDLVAAGQERVSFDQDFETPLSSTMALQDPVESAPQPSSAAQAKHASSGAD